MTQQGRRWPDGVPVAVTSVDGRITQVQPIPESPDLPWIMPGIVDNHCHILPTGLDLQKLHLGGLDTREAVLDAVRSRVQETPDGNHVLAVHYDQTRFPDGRHLSREELDATSVRHPIILRHVNGHASVANSLALDRAGVTSDEPNPDGGEYLRDASGRMTGVLLELAHERVTAAVPNPDLEQMVSAILAAGEKMASYGIRTASDMMTGRFDLDLELQAYRLAAERGCPIRMRLYLQWGRVFGSRHLDAERLRELVDAFDGSRVRVGGIKIFADGAIGSRTAAIYGHYSGSELTEHEGQLIYAPDKLQAMIVTAAQAGYQVAVHSIGDRATDLVMSGFEQTPDPGRHRIEHAMILSDAQIERMATIGCHVTMQPEFLVRFGHSYLRQLGAERAAHLKRYRSVLDQGLRLSFGSDRPIVEGDPWLAIRAAVSRPAGFEPAENLRPAEAVHAYTGAAADSNEDFGDARLAVGATADPILVESDRLKMDPV